MAFGPLEEAFVEVTADVSRAERDLAGFHETLEDTERVAQQVGEQIEDAFIEAARTSDRALERVGDGAFRDVENEAQRAARGIVTAMVQAGSLADSSLERIGGADVFAELVVQAKLAGRGIEVAFRDVAGNLRGPGGQLFPPGMFTGIVVESRVAASEVALAFEAAGVRSASSLRDIGGIDSFGPAVASAEIAAESIEHSFRDSSRDSIRALSRIGTAGAGFSLIGTGAAAAAIGVGAAATALVGFGVVGAASLETTRIGFEALLGSAAEADAFIREMQQFAAATPFEFQGLAENARKLLAVSDAIGITREAIIPTIETIGDLTAILGAPPDAIDRVVRALGQMGSRGKVTSEEMLQLAEALPGFQPFKAMADGLGLTTAELQDQITAGLIPAKEGIDALLEGMGEFPGAAGAMIAQSQTLTGVFSTFKDTIQLSLVEAFGPLAETLKTFLADATPVMQASLDQLAPALSETAEGVLATVFGVLEGLTPGLTAIFAGIGTSLQVLAGPLAEFASHISVAFAGLEQLLPALAQALIPVIDAFGDLAIAVLPPLIGAITTVVVAFTPLIELVAGLVSALASALSPILIQVGDLLADVGRVVGDVFAEFAQSKALDDLVASFLDLIGVARDVFTAFTESKGFDSLVESLGELAAATLPVIAALGSGLLGALAVILPPLGELAVILADTLADVLTNAIIPVLPELSDAFVTIAGALAEVLPPLAELAIILVEALAPIISEIAEIMGETLAVNLELIAGIFAEMAEALIPLLPALGEVAAVLGEAFLEAVTELAPIMPELTQAFADMAIAFAEILVALTPLIGPMTDLMLILLEIGGPVLVLFVTGLAGVVGMMAQVTEAVAMGASVFSGPLAIGLQIAIQSFAILAEILSGAVAGAVSTVSGLLTGGMQVALQVVFGAGQILAGLLNGALQLGLQVVFGGAQLVAGVLNGALQGAIQVVIGVASFLAGILNGALQVGLTVVAGAAGIARGAFHGLQGAIQVVSGAAGSVRDALGRVASFIRDTLNGAINAAAGIWRGLQGAIGGVLGVLQNIIGAASNAVGAISDVVNAVKNLPGAGFLGGVLGAISPFAAGGIVDEPTIALLGEQSKREVVLPLDDPARSLALSHESGLLDVLAKAAAFGSRPITPPARAAAVTHTEGGGATIINLSMHFGTVPSVTDARAAARAAGDELTEVLDRRQARVTARIAS